MLVRETIIFPGPVDTFRIQVESGLCLAFEIETPVLGQHRFSPLLRVIDDQGEQAYSNIFHQVGGDGDDWIKTIHPKVTHTFEKGRTTSSRSATDASPWKT